MVGLVVQPNCHDANEAKCPDLLGLARHRQVRTGRGCHGVEAPTRRIVHRRRMRRHHALDRGDNLRIVRDDRKDGTARHLGD